MKLGIRLGAAVTAAGLVIGSLAGCASSSSGSGSSGGTTPSAGSAAGGSTSGGGASGGTITLGMVVPLTGSSAAIGPYMQNGAQLAVNEINEAGGVLGKQLKLDVQDGACDAKSAATAANKLVSDKVAVSVGGYCSGATLPTLPIFNGAGIPMIIPAANSDDLVNQKLPLVFLINGTGTQQAQAALKFMTKEGVKKVALMDDNTSYSTNITKNVADLMKKAPDGPQQAIHESVTAGESDYSANVNAVIKSQPDFVYWTGYYQEGGLIIKQLRQAGYTGKIMVADGSVDQKLIQIAGQDNAQGVFATMTQTPQTIPDGQAWIDKYKKAFNADPGPYSTQSYDAVRVAAEALKNAGSTDGKAVADALMKIDGFKLFSGPLKFTPEHTLSSGGFLILVVKGENFDVQDQLQD